MRAAFERAARTYDPAADLQRQVADQLMERLDVVRLTPQCVLDVGCGTGYCTRLLASRYPQAQVIGLDLAHAMAHRARNRWHWRFWKRPDFLCGDAEQLPFVDAGIDMVLSNLALQWCQPMMVFNETRRVLRPGGLFVFTTFGPDTLRELRSAWSDVDGQPHVHSFLDLRDVGDLLLAAGFRDPVVDVERVVLHRRSVREVLRELKLIGAHNVAQGRSRGLTGKAHFTRFQQAYEALATPQGIPVTYEVVYGHAWAPTEMRARELPQEAIIPLSSIRRRG